MSEDELRRVFREQGRIAREHEMQVRYPGLSHLPLNVVVVLDTPAARRLARINAEAEENARREYVLLHGDVVDSSDEDGG